MSDILEHVEVGVMTLTFNRLEKKNSITLAMYATLADSLEQAARDDAVRVAVIQGDASVFSAGNDLTDFQNAPAANEALSDERSAARFLHTIASFLKPLVAAVCGPAVGIGLSKTCSGVWQRQAHWAMVQWATHLRELMAEWRAR